MTKYSIAYTMKYIKMCIKKLKFIPLTTLPTLSASIIMHSLGTAPGGVLRFELDRGVPLEPQNPYPSLRVSLAEKGTHF